MPVASTRRLVPLLSSNVFSDAPTGAIILGGLWTESYTTSPGPDICLPTIAFLSGMRTSASVPAAGVTMSLLPAKPTLASTNGHATTATLPAKITLADIPGTRTAAAVSGPDTNADFGEC